MRFYPQIEQLESRDAPSAFTPASPVVSFAPSSQSGVPFMALTNPGNDSGMADFSGFAASAAALIHAGVYGAPLV